MRRSGDVQVRRKYAAAALHPEKFAGKQIIS